MFKSIFNSILIIFYCVNQVELNKYKNDKFLDYGVDFIPLDINHHDNNFNNFNLFNYPSIKSKSLNMSQKNFDFSNPTVLEKKKQKEIVTRLIDSINFDVAADHQIGKIISADQLPTIGHRYQKVDLDTLSTYRLEFLGFKLREKKKFNHYIIIKKRTKSSNNYPDYMTTNRNNHLNTDNSLFYTYQNTPLFIGHTLLSRNGLKKNFDHFINQNTTTDQYRRSKLSNDVVSNNGQYVFCSVFVQKNVNFGRKAIRIAFYQSMKDNLNEFNTLMPQTKVHNIWLTDLQQHTFKTLKPMERLSILSGGMGMLYKTV